MVIILLIRFSFVLINFLRAPTYVEEQHRIKNDLKNALDNITEGDDWKKVCVKREKTDEEVKREEADYKQWLLGVKDELDDKSTQNDLQPLKDYWTNKSLDDGEKFLRDFILKKRFVLFDDQTPFITKFSLDF